MNHDFTVTFKPSPMGTGLSMTLHAYSETGSSMCRKIVEAFIEQGLLMNEENFDLVTKQLGYTK